MTARATASATGSGAGTLSRLASHGRESPWMNSVPAVTVNAISSSVLRCGVSLGMTNAAASVTTPRMPAQPRRIVNESGRRARLPSAARWISR